MRPQLRRIVCSSAVAVLFAALSVAMAPASSAAASHATVARDVQLSPQVIRPAGVPAGCNVGVMVASLNSLQASFLLGTGVPANALGEVYEYASYNPVTETYSGCDWYYAHVQLWTYYNPYGPHAAIWIYNAGGSYLASTASGGVIDGYSAWSSWTTTVYSPTGIKAKLGAANGPGETYQTQYPFPTGGGVYQL